MNVIVIRYLCVSNLSYLRSTVGCIERFLKSEEVRPSFSGNSFLPSRNSRLSPFYTIIYLDSISCKELYPRNYGIPMKYVKLICGNRNVHTLRYSPMTKSRLRGSIVPPASGHQTTLYPHLTQMLTCFGSLHVLQSPEMVFLPPLSCCPIQTVSQCSRRISKNFVWLRGRSGVERNSIILPSYC